MRINRYLPLALLALTFSWAACNSDVKNEAKTPWTAKERQDFRDGCFLSARFSFEQMKQNVDSVDLITICNCTADDIESQYNFAAAKRIPKAKINEILEKALAKCAPEVMFKQAVDSSVKSTN